MIAKCKLRTLRKLMAQALEICLPGPSLQFINTMRLPIRILLPYLS